VEEEGKRATEEKSIMMEQKLSNHLHTKNIQYEPALEIALELETPRPALKVSRLVCHFIHLCELLYLI
jgi:hypothetical protein